MKKIGFVVPWFGFDIPGGAENETRELVCALKSANVEVEVLTTCAKDFNSDWSKNYYKEGIYNEREIQVLRFPVRKRDNARFDQINLKLINGLSVTDEEEKGFIEEMINSPRLYEYIRDNQDAYYAFMCVSYMFGTTYFGALIAPEKTYLIPCFHEEAYFHMNIFKQAYSNVAGLIYNAEPEKKLVEETYQLSSTMKQIVMGIGMDTDVHGNADIFRQKYAIQEEFILYAGRKDAGKNVDVLIQYFAEYRKRNDPAMKLVLIGGGSIDIPKSEKDAIIDLGFVDKQDKYDACAAALCLCQPSTHESFSYVIMESWLCGRPVLVHEGCDVTKDFAIRSNGGLYFKDYFEFEGCVNFYRKNNDVASQMGDNGRDFVKCTFSWDVIISKYKKFLNIC